MKPMMITAIALIAIAFLLLTAGCTQQTGTTTPVPTVAPVKELRIGYQPSTHQMAEITAMAKGWWQEDLAPFGVVNVTDKVFPSGPPEMQAMLAGELDVAYVGAAPVLSALSTGLDAKIVAGVNTQGSDLVVRNDIVYTGPQSLKREDYCHLPTRQYPGYGPARLAQEEQPHPGQGCLHQGNDPRRCRHGHPCR